MEPRLAQVDRLDCRLTPHRWDFAEAEAVRIEAHWAARRARIPSMYDGPVLLAHRAAIEDAAGARVLRVEAFETRFSRFLAWREFGWPDTSVFNFFAMPVLRSSDGAWLVGEMGPDHSAAGQLYFPGGTPDPGDVTEDGRVDLFGSLARELAEETGLPADEGAIAPGWTVVFDRQRVACLRRIDWPAPAAAIRARVRRFLDGEARPELAGVHMLAAGRHDDPRLPAFVTAFLARAAETG
jgi:8-oxo-dGTP pyrophosphatase MutT (NUDIX family)